MNRILDGKNVLLIVTGGIAAVKAFDICSRLQKRGAAVRVIMTENAGHFISPESFEAITKTKTVTDTFDRSHPFSIEHISLSNWADLCLIAPATANIIGKIANGIADDMPTTTIMAFNGPCLIAPAMNSLMWENPILQDNIKRLSAYGYRIIEPASGHLACGTEGKGRLPETDDILWEVEKALEKKDLLGLKILISAGPTRESIDPVRFITNHSTGKMGYNIAGAAVLRGASVTLVSGPVNLEAPKEAFCINVTSAREMGDEINKHFPECDMLIMSAAVADFRPKKVNDGKIKKKDGLNLELEKTGDILKSLPDNSGKLLCGFSMETENLIENSRKKLFEKNLDLICCNDLKTPGAGFGTDTNVLTLITKNDIQRLPIMTKWEASEIILDTLLKLREEKNDFR